MRPMRRDDIKLISKIAWSYQRTTGLDFDDLFSVASIGYCRGINTWKENAGAKRTTWCYYCMQNELNGYLQQRERFYQFPEDNDSEDDDIPFEDYYLQNEIDPYKELEFKDSIKALSTNSRTLIKIIFESPNEFLEQAPKLNRGKIKNLLRKQGWSWSEIWNSFKEIKELLNEY